MVMTNIVEMASLDAYLALLWLITSTVYWYNSIYLFPSLIVSYIDCFDLSSDIHPGHQCYEHFHSIHQVYPYSAVLLPVPVTVLLSIGYGGLALCTSDFLRWPSYAASLFFLIKTWEIVWSDLHISVSPAYCSYIYGSSQTCHVWKVSCLCSEWVGISMQLVPHLVGQLLLLLCKSGGPDDIVYKL